jgi:hypothetical protein
MAFNQSSESPLSATVQRIFAEEIEAVGGTVSDAIEAGGWSFLRSVLPATRDVQPKDRLQAGVALRSSELEAWVHPYVFRQVCSNGAIFAHAIQSYHLADLDLRSPDEREALIREAVQVCRAPEAFEGAVAGMRAAMGQTVEERHALEIASMMINLTRSPGHRSGAADRRLFEMVMRITEGFQQQPVRTRYTLMNAVTATARDTREPALRWRLEELGGAIASGLMPKNPRMPHRAEVRDAVTV